MSDNDFTLDELVLIQDNLHWSDCPAKNSKLINLDHKLTDMIANYCDHDYEQTHIEIEMEYCKKCGIQSI